MNMNLRPARPEDAAALVRLIDMAGDGLPRWLWQRAASPGQSAEEVGLERATRDTGGFSFRHAHVLDHDGVVVAMLLDYRLDDPYELPELMAIPEPVRPLLELESLAAGAWYINAVATLPEWRGRGLGRRLMGLADERARSAGASQVALVVAGDNRDAVRLYERLGYSEAARREIVPWPGCPHRGDYLLMTHAV